MNSLHICNKCQAVFYEPAFLSPMDKTEVCPKCTSTDIFTHHDPSLQDKMEELRIILNKVRDSLALTKQKVGNLENKLMCEKHDFKLVEINDRIRPGHPRSVTFRCSKCGLEDVIKERLS